MAPHFWAPRPSARSATIRSPPSRPPARNWRWQPLDYRRLQPRRPGPADDDVSTGTLTQTVDYTPGDLIVTQVGTGVTQVGGGIASIAPVTGSSGVYTVTTNSPHGLYQGEGVTLAGVTPYAFNSTGYSTYTATVTGPNTFTISATSGLVATSTNQTGATVSTALASTANQAGCRTIQAAPSTPATPKRSPAVRRPSSSLPQPGPAPAMASSP